MRVFCDASVLVAAAVASHEQHVSALHLIERVAAGRLPGSLGAHGLAETYSVLTRLPLMPRIPPEEAARLIEENFLPHFSIWALDADEYLQVVRRAAVDRLPGGAIYDALLLASAVKAKADRIYTFDIAHFRRIAPQLHKKIVAP
jgi:predicted nucleic acid-binding protein